MAFLFSHSLRLQKDPVVNAYFCGILVRDGLGVGVRVRVRVRVWVRIRVWVNKNVLARTIKGQAQRFRRLLHILCKPNGNIAP